MAIDFQSLSEHYSVPFIHKEKMVGMAIALRGIGWHFLTVKADQEVLSDRSIPAMVYQAVCECVDDAGIGIDDIDGVVTASVDLWDGKTASNIAVTEAVGAVMKAETRIAGDGLLALMHGAMMVMSGHYNRVLVVAHGKNSETDTDAVSNWAFDPVYQQALGLSDAQALELQSQATGSDGEVFVPGDGACAVILEAGDNGVVLEGFGYDLDAHYLGDRDMAGSAGLTRAARRAFEMAGVSGGDAIGRYYWSLRNSGQLPGWSAAVGAEGAGENHQIAGDGLPPFAAGLQRLIAATRDLRKQPGLGRALVQGCHGPAAQMQAVCILNNQRGM